jgi:hypothetical protein
MPSAIHYTLPISLYFDLNLKFITGIILPDFILASLYIGITKSRQVFYDKVRKCD